MGKGKHRAVSPQRQMVGSIVAAGAVPLVIALIGTGTASADPVPAPVAGQPIPGGTPAVPIAAPQPDPAALIQAVTAPVTQAAADLTAQVTADPAVRAAADNAVQAATDLAAQAGVPLPPAATQFTATLPEPAPVAEPAPIDQVVPPADAPVTRPIPNHSYLAPLGELHAPVPVEKVAPIEAPPGKLRVGYVMIDDPHFPGLDIAPINEGAAQAEADLATFLDSVGIERTRSDKIASQVLGSAAIGASVGSTVASPIASSGAMVGAIAGFISGIPFLPIGLLVGPVIGAAIGYAFVAAPFAAVGAGVGAAVGAIDGFAAPPHGTAPATPS